MKWTNKTQLPPESEKALPGEAGFSATVLVHDPDFKVTTTAWYDYERCKWDTDCPVDGLREEELNEENITHFWSLIPTPNNMGETSDGYHTFNELYEHRSVLFIALIREMGNQMGWKSWKHDDGTMFDGMFICGLKLPGTDTAITYHLEAKYWDKVDVCELDKAYPWDGHTSEDVIKRLEKEYFPPF